MKIIRIPELGDKVKITSFLVKTYNHQTKYRDWKVVIFNDKTAEYRSGIWVGSRTLASGTLVEGRYAPDEWEPGYLKVDRTLKVYIVITHPRINPFYVLPEYVTFLEE